MAVTLLLAVWLLYFVIDWPCAWLLGIPHYRNVTALADPGGECIVIVIRRALFVPLFSLPGRPRRGRGRHGGGVQGIDWNGSDTRGIRSEPKRGWVEDESASHSRISEGRRALCG